MKKLFALFVMFIFVLTSAYALDCEYTDIKQVENTTMQYAVNRFIEEVYPPFVNITGLRNWKAQMGYKLDYEFYLVNNLRFPLDLTVYYNVAGKQNIRNVSLDPYGKQIIKGQYNQDRPRVIKNEIYFDIKSIEEIQRTEIVNVTECEICPSKEICLNDGASCVNKNQCGGENCVEGRCSASENCYNNDCECDSNEVQCTDNKRCVKKFVIPLDNMPKCNLPEECVYEYINTTTGLCAKSPAQKQEEENQLLKEELARKEKKLRFMVYTMFGLAFIIIFGVGILWYLKNEDEKERLRLEHEREKEKLRLKKEREKERLLLKKKHEEEKLWLEHERKKERLRLKKKHEEEIQRTIGVKHNADIKKEEEKQKTLQKEMDIAIKHLETKNKEIEKIEAEMKKEQYKIQQKDKEIHELKLKKHKTQKEIQRINALSKELQRNEAKFEKRNKEKIKRIKDITKGREKEISKLKKVSKERYQLEYETRYHKRIWIDDNGYFRFKDSNKSIHRWIYEDHYSVKIKEGHHIHHIDANHFNCDIWNLIELTGYDHQNILRHRKIIFGDWESGIKELERIGLSEDRFPEEVKKHLKKMKK